MNEGDTTHLMKGSLLAKIGVNVRGIIVIMLCGTICILTGLKIQIAQELYWLTSAAVTYYFGQQHERAARP